MYARPHGKEIWTMLLEKAGNASKVTSFFEKAASKRHCGAQAFAKLCGSYASTEVQWRL